MYILLSSEYDTRNFSFKYIFLNVETGERIVHSKLMTDHLPYFYVRMTEKQLLTDPRLIDEGYIENDTFNSKLIMSVENVKKKDIMNDREVYVSKVNLNPMYWSYTRKYGIIPLHEILPDGTIHGNKEKYIDQYTRESGLVMGMVYEKVNNNFKILKSSFIPDHKSFREYPDNMVRWISPRLFSSIPNISHHVIAIDIEVDIPQKRKPDVFNVEFPISSIVFAAQDIIVAYYIEDEIRGTIPEKFERYDFEGAIVKGFKSEKEMIDNAIKFLINTHHKIVAGFYSDSFDFPYLMTRAELFGLVYDEVYGRVDRHFDPVTKKHTTRIVKGVKNKWVIDVHSFMSNPSIKNYAFGGKYEYNTLEDISQGILGYGKYQHEKWYSEMSSAELVYYNIKDTKLVIDLLKYDDEIVIKLMIMFMRLGGLTFEGVSRRMISATIKGFFEHLMNNDNILIPSEYELKSVGRIESVSDTGKGFKGALVGDPKPVEEGGWGTRGVHFNVIAVDYQSLYPSEIKNRNICFSTINCRHEICKDNKVPYLSHHICIKKKGFISLIIGFIRDARVYYFKPKKKERPTFKVIEQALKVFINASYGVTSSPMFDYYCPPMGEIVTAFGRRDIKKVFDKVRGDGRMLLYSDTDSCFIGETDIDYINGVIDWIRKEIGLELGIDYIADVMCLYRSKNYFMVIDNNLMIKGMTGKKKHTPPIIKEAFNNILSIMKDMTKDNVDIIKDKVRTIINKYRSYIMTGEFDDVSLFKITKTITKEPTMYKIPNPQSRAAMMLANHLNSELDRKIAISKLVPAGSVIEYVYVYSNYALDGMNKSTVVRPLELTEPFMIDKEKYFDMMLSTLSQVMIPLGIDKDEFNGQMTLDNWFL